MARPLSFVRLDIARFGVELSDLSDAEIIYWVKSFYRSLALQDPKLNDFAASLLEESHEYRNAESERVKAYLRRKNTELPVITTQNITKQNKAKQSRTNKHSFNHSDFYSFEKFREALPEWSEEKCQHYHRAATEYSGSKGAKYLDWRLAVMSWDRKEPFEQRKNKGTNNDGRSPRRKRLDEDAHRITELSERIAGNDRGLHQAHVPISRPSGSD